MLFLSSSSLHRDLHSFPTRRSSDLATSSKLRPPPKGRPGALGMGRCIAVHLSIDTAASPHAESTGSRSEEHTTELQSLRHLVCRLLLEKKKDSAMLLVMVTQHVGLL